MIINRNDISTDFDTIPINSFWNVGDQKELKMHRIHAYPAKFPAFITTKALEYSKEKGLSINSIADVFCGCGTTAFEAGRNNKQFWGCDINPVATLIARAKSRKYSENKLDKYYRNTVKNYNKIKIEKKETHTINERIKYWFNSKQIENLLKLKKAIIETVPARSFYRDFFFCAYSNILKPTSNWLTKSIKPQIDPDKMPSNVIKSFELQYAFMYSANMENDIKRHYSKKIKIQTLNFLKKQFSKPCVDMIITSPPYVTSYEYADLHQLSTLWLDFTNDYRSFRSSAIGSLYHNDKFIKNAKILNTTGEKTVFRLFDVHKLKARTTAKYFADMAVCVSKCWDMLNKKGMVLFVIGNTEFKGVKIDNAKYLAECMLDSGFSAIDLSRRKISGKILTPYRDSKGKFTSNSNSRKVYAEEFILIGRKT